MKPHRKGLFAILPIVVFTSCSDTRMVAELEGQLEVQSEELAHERKAHATYAEQAKELGDQIDHLRAAHGEAEAHLDAEQDRAKGTLAAVRSYIVGRQGRFVAIQDMLQETDPAFDDISMALFGVRVQLAMAGYEDIDKISELLDADSG